jgi:hypothetical protein
MTTPPSKSCPACGAKASGKFCNQCGAALGGSSCRSCSAPLSAGARFCNDCGTPVGAEPVVAAAPSGGASAWLPWTIAGALLVGVVSYFLAQAASVEGSAQMAQSGADGGAQTAPFANGGGGGAPPDISQMSPRERAGRLYDRIMRYVEEGKIDSAQFFAPMAMSSFEALGSDLDLDARYDYGRVAQETGSVEIAAAQADTILRQSPTHLLGLALAARAAEQGGKTKAASALWARFVAAKDAEVQKALPEYQAHAGDIERAAALAKGK